MTINLKRAIIGLLMCCLLIGAFPGINILAATDATKTTMRTDTITPAGLTQAEVEGKVDAYIKDYLDETVPGAAVTIVKDGQMILQKGYGYSNLEKKTKVDPNSTVFRFGNLSQIYTWTAVLQLVEQGKLDLKEDILTYLPEDFGLELKEHLISTEPITLTNLINHTAGFEELGHDTVFWESSKLQESLKECLLVTMPNQIYAPGRVMTGDSYSVSLAAYIIEQVSGVSYPEYVKTNILDKIGADHTTFLKNESIVKELGDNLATEYLMDANGNYMPAQESYSNLYQADSVIGTNEDLVKLMNQLMQGKEDSLLLSKSSLDTMYTKSYAIIDQAKAALHGLYEYPADIQAYYCDGGTASTSMMVMMPETGFGLVITTNSKASLELLYGLSYELLLGDTKTTVTPKDDLPGVGNVTDREYVGSKRPYDGALEFIGYYANSSKFTRVDKHTISLGSEKYVQVAPYVFKYAGESDNPLYKTMASTIYFQTDSSEKAFKWSYSASEAAEYVYSSDNKTQSYLSMTVFLLIISIVFVFVMAFIAILGLIRDAIKRKFNWKGVKVAFGIFTVLLCLTVLNNWAVFSDISNVQGIMASAINPHIVINIMLSVVQLISLGYLIYRMRHERQTIMRNILIVFTTVIYIGSIYFLQTWNFYSLM